MDNISKDFTNDRGEKVHFEIVYDSLGRPIRQKQTFYHNDSEYSYCFERYKDDLSGKRLYHITFDSKIENIFLTVFYRELEGIIVIIGSDCLMYQR